MVDDDIDVEFLVLFHSPTPADLEGKGWENPAGFVVEFPDEGDFLSVIHAGGLSKEAQYKMGMELGATTHTQTSLFVWFGPMNSKEPYEGIMRPFLKAPLAEDILRAHRMILDAGSRWVVGAMYHNTLHLWYVDDHTIVGEQTWRLGVEQKLEGATGCAVDPIEKPAVHIH